MEIQELFQPAVEHGAKNLVRILELFAPNVQNKLMNTRIENAETAIKDIKNRLEQYGLQIDYQRYFEEKLQVPLTLIRELSETENASQTELLKELFMRHLSGMYDDDSRYMIYIDIIKHLTSTDIKVLSAIKFGAEIPLTASEYVLSKFYQNTEISYEDLIQSIENLLRQVLIRNTKNVSVPDTKGINMLILDGGGAKEEEHTEPIFPQQSVLQESIPELTELGKGFLKACSYP